jgi:hypothetical protein
VCSHCVKRKTERVVPGEFVLAGRCPRCGGDCPVDTVVVSRRPKPTPRPQIALCRDCVDRTIEQVIIYRRDGGVCERCQCCPVELRAVRRNAPVIQLFPGPRKG